jgi:hypothetical protein
VPGVDDDPPAGLDCLAHHGDQVERHVLHLNQPPGDARHFQQVVDQANEMGQLALEDRQHARRLGIARGQAQVLDAGDQRRQRISQLVAERRQELVLPLVGQPQRLFDAGAFVDVAPNLVLPIARAQRRAHGTQQRRDAQRPLEQRDVAEGPHGLARGRRVRTRERQHQDRQVGPGRLPRQCRRQPGVALGRDHLFGHDEYRRAANDLVERLVEAGADVDGDFRLPEQGRRGGRILARRRKHEDAIVDRRGCRRGHCRGSGSIGSTTGTPVSTPRNSRSGGPTLMPVASSVNSRIVRSWRPPRFLRTESACRTSPRASK